MNNSDIIAALSLALTAIIFLLQTDDGLLKLKFGSWEKRIILIGIVLIIILCNHEIFDRLNATYYFTFERIFLTPNEWALIIFLGLISFLLSRVFSNKIFNRDVRTIFQVIQKYRAEKKLLKLQNVLQQVIELKNFENDFGEQLNDSIFNDHFLIEYFASNCPELLIKFAEKYNEASICTGEHFYHILNGLFADKSNPIFAEIRLYKNDEIKQLFVCPYQTQSKIEGFQLDLSKNYRSPFQIISWLTDILRDFSINIGKDSLYFLNQFRDTTTTSGNNKRIYSKNEIETALSRDPLYNAIQLFRILLIEVSFNDRRIVVDIGRMLALLYNSWDFVESCTQLKSDKVQLGNDSYTVNEYLQEYLFESYCSIFLLNNKILLARHDHEAATKEYTGLIVDHLFRKVDSLIASDAIGENSKEYYLKGLFDLYFDMPNYLSDDALDQFDTGILHCFERSLKDSPYGNSIIYRQIFRRCCAVGGYEFWSETDLEKRRRDQFYTSLLPYTSDFQWRICQGR